MIGRWLQRLGRAVVRPAPIDDSAWNALVARSPLFARLDADELDRLRALSARFLAAKTFSAAGGHELVASHCLAIAALACLPVLNLGFAGLAGWREVIVYPGEFRARRQHFDEHTGVITEGEDDLIGEAWERGPVILSWADVATDLAQPFDGFNVVVHEIAHKLDLLDGTLDGVPSLPPGLTRADWVATMQPAYDAHRRAVDRGRDTLIDPYAAEAADEYFAVVSELHFSDPALLRRAAAPVADLLARFYGPRVPATSVAVARSHR